MSVSSEGIWCLESSHFSNFQPPTRVSFYCTQWLFRKRVFVPPQKEIPCHLNMLRGLQFRPFKYSIFPSKIQDSTHLLSVRRLQEFCKPMLFLIKEVPMRCHRCGGIMVYEKFYGPHEQFFGWRCIFCGEIVDEVILENRFAQRVR
jgi:hypothetical protein